MNFVGYYKPAVNALRCSKRQISFSRIYLTIKYMFIYSFIKYLQCIFSSMENNMQTHFTDNNRLSPFTYIMKN